MIKYPILCKGCFRPSLCDYLTDLADCAPSLFEVPYGLAVEFLKKIYPTCICSK